MTKLKGLWRKSRAFIRATSANVAMMFGLSLLPLAIAAGAGLDFAHAMMERSDMSDALDAAALAVGAQPGMSQSAATALAQNVFNANFKGTGSPTITPVINGQSVSVTASEQVATTLLAVVGKPTIDVTASSVVVWGQTKLWVGLVLDNTGSMCEPDSNPCPGDTNVNIKINALKSASHGLLTILQNAATNPGDVQVAIAPFTKDVNVGTSHVSDTWIDWTDWSKNFPAGAPSTNTGPGDSCPSGWSSYGCVTAPGSTTGTSNIPSSGTYSGYACPGSLNSSSTGQAGHYYNGCYTSAVTTTRVSSGSSASCSGYSHCTCTGSGSSKVCNNNTWTWTWALNPRSTWTGCVMDRGPATIPGGDVPANDYDTNTTAPVVGTTNSLFPAENDDSCPTATISTLSYDWTSLNAKIDTMVAGGGTNQTVGLAHGMLLLTNNLPYTSGALPVNTTRYIILLSDGLNTMDRWYGNGSAQSASVDTRMAAACANAKTAGFIIYTVFVDLNGTQGNSTVLQNCASDSSKYYDLTTSSAIVTTFNQIAQQITNLRVSH